jgi:hypothetical protein
MTEIDWAHRESLRAWAMLAARGHEGAQAVATYHGLEPAPPRGLPPAARAPAPVSAIAPRAPRPTVPAPVQPTPALAGVTRRTEVLTSLLGARPTPAAPADLV